MREAAHATGRVDGLDVHAFSPGLPVMLAAVFIVVLRCFSNGCRERILVNMSAVFSGSGMWRTETISAPRSSLILNSLRSMWRVC